MRCLAIDPGGTSALTRKGRAIGTGGATGMVLFEPVDKFKINVLDWWEVVDRVNLLRLVHSMMLHPLGINTVVVEAYKDAGFVKTWEPDVIYIIGTVHYLTEVYGGTFVNSTFAATAKQWATPTKLNEYRTGDHPVGKGGKGHALMALSHALHWTAFQWDGTK